MDDMLKFAALLALISLAGLFFFFFDPGNHAVYPPCPFHALTGLYCPGCGSLRALHQLLHGNIAAALRLNPLAVAVLPFFAYAFVACGARAWSKDPPELDHAPAFWIWLLLAVIIAFWVGRNIPCYPFTSMAP